MRRSNRLASQNYKKLVGKADYVGDSGAVAGKRDEVTAALAASQSVQLPYLM